MRRQMNAVRALRVLVGMTLVSASLAACQQAGAPSSSSLMDDRFTSSFAHAHLVADRTTKDQVIALYGQPNRADQSSIGDHWIYYSSPTTGSSGGGSVPLFGQLNNFMGNAGQLSSALGLNTGGAVTSGTYRPSRPARP